MSEALPERWTVRLGDSSWNTLHEVDAGEFRGVLRRNAPGPWRVRLPLDEITCSCPIDDVATVRVLNGTRVVFSGWVARLDSAGGGVVRTISADERTLTLEGVDAWYPLTTRLAFPNPATGAPWSTATDDRSGLASTVAANYVLHNVGAPALVDRQWPDLVVSDPAVGPSVSWAARLQPLHRLVAEICGVDVVCRPVVDIDGQTVVRFALASDRSTSLVLSDEGELSDVQQSIVPPGVTWVLAAGSGTGASRQFAVASSAAAGLDRIEALTEQTNATTAQLPVAAEAVRRDLSVALSVDGQVTAVASRRYRYAIDYDLGDLLGVVVDRVRYATPVTAVQVEVTPERSVAVPALGTWSNDRLQGMRRDVLGLAERFDRSIQ